MVMLLWSSVPARHPRWALQEVFKVLSRLISTHNYQKFSWLEDELISSKDQIFSDLVIKPQLTADLELLVELLQHGSKPTPYFLNKIVSSCAKWDFFHMGIQVHSIIIKMGFISNVYMCSALVRFYGNCRVLSDAQQMFDETPCRSVVTWNSMISSYMHAASPEISISVFINMLNMGMVPTPFSVSVILVACSQLEAKKFGILVHGLSLKAGFCSNVVVGTGLINMYSKCGNVDDSRRVFNQMPNRNVITWTSMVTGYARHQKPNEGMILVKKMLSLGLRPNYVTYNSLLSSFSCGGDFNNFKQVHCRVIREGLETNAYIVVSLMTVYSECSCSLEDFYKLCSDVTKWDIISWNAVITGFSNLGSSDEALKWFSVIRQEGISADFFTFVSILRAAGIVSALKEGKQIHVLVLKTGYISNLNVQNGLVSMYARSGAVHDSKRVFSSMKEHDLISWNALLSGFAHHGYGREAIEMFEQMRKTGIKPDRTTYLSVLSACSHVKKKKKGLEYFDLMRNDNLLNPPQVEHYACIVDLYGRAGYLHEAEAFINSMTIEPGPSVFKALLSACHVHGNIEIAERSAKKLLQLCPYNPGTYILLSKIFATEGYWNDAAEVRKIMCDRGVTKEPGYSRI